MNDPLFPAGQSPAAALARPLVPVRIVTPRAARLLHAAILLGCAALLAVGFSLSPDARGYGTHERLGLPPCPVHQITGLPCATCGFTTSLACAAHLQFGAGIHAHVLGTLAFLGAAAFVAWTLAAPLFRRAPTAALRLFGSKWLWWPLVGLFYFSWLVNLAAALAGRRGN